MENKTTVIEQGTIFKVGDHVAINFTKCYQHGGYDSIEDMLPYFETSQSDELTQNGCEFVITDISFEDTFSSGEKYQFLLVRPLLDHVVPEEWVDVDFIKDDEGEELAEKMLNSGFILIESYDLDLIRRA